MNWGKGLVLALVSFAALMAWFIVKAQQNPEPLVTEQYYEQELKYQERIEATERANRIGEVGITATRTSVRISFPDSLRGSTITGDLLLQRPNDPSEDRMYTVTASAGMTDLDAELTAGRYNAELSWTTNGIPYFTKAKITVL